MLYGKSGNINMGQRLQPKKPAVAKRKKQIKIRAIKGGVYLLLTVSMIIGSVMMGMYFSKSNRVIEIVVNGEYFTNPAEIVQISGIVPGIQADSLNFIEILDRVESLPYIHHAFAEVSHSGLVRIRVIERQPIMQLVEGDQRNYVDRDGVKLPRFRGKLVDVPIYYDLGYDTGKDILNSKAFRQTREFLLTAAASPIVPLTISEMAWTPDEGVVALSHESTVRLVFGHSQFRRAVNEWEYFYTRIIPEEGISNFRRIDFRFAGQVVTVKT